MREQCFELRVEQRFYPAPCQTASGVIYCQIAGDGVWGTGDGRTRAGLMRNLPLLVALKVFFMGFFLFVCLFFVFFFFFGLCCPCGYFLVAFMFIDFVFLVVVFILLLFVIILFYVILLGFRIGWVPEPTRAYFRRLNVSGSAGQDH